MRSNLKFANLFAEKHERNDKVVTQYPFGNFQKTFWEYSQVSIKRAARLTTYSCWDNYSTTILKVRQVFKGGNNSKASSIYRVVIKQFSDRH